MAKWYMWNGYPSSDGPYRAERIGPEGQGGITTDAESADLCGTKTDLELAAAAPELLAACRVALQFAKAMREEPIDSQPLEDHIRELEAVIAKAEGPKP